MENLVAMPPADDENVFFATNLNSVTPLNVMSLASNNSSDDAEGNYNGPNNFNVSFNGSQMMIIIGLLGFIIIIGFFFTIICRSSTNGEHSRVSRRIVDNYNVRRGATQGLERTLIESFPVFNYNVVKGLKAQANGSECTVCLSDFEDEEMVRLLPKCSHAFHPECIDMWLCSHTTCPVCRTSLLPADDSNPTGTVFAVVEEQITIVIDNGGGLSHHGSVQRDISNDEATSRIPETSHDSTGHSLVRVQKELGQPTEWYVDTPSGLTPGLHRSRSFVSMHQSQGQSRSKAPPARSKLGGSMDEAECRSRSERWGSMSMNPAAFVKRTFSERITAQPREQREVEQPGSKAYLKRTLSWLIGGNMDKGESSQNGSGSSRRADQIVGTSTI